MFSLLWFHLDSMQRITNRLSTVLTVLSILGIGTDTAHGSAATPYIPVGNLEELAKLMPTNGLPLPNSLKLKYVVLGVGTQNYTCTSGDENDAPGTSGAIGKVTSSNLEYRPVEECLTQQSSTLRHGNRPHE
jgi:hypothetical protein